MLCEPLCRLQLVRRVPGVGEGNIPSQPERQLPAKQAKRLVLP